MQWSTNVINKKVLSKNLRNTNNKNKSLRVQWRAFLTDRTQLSSPLSDEWSPVVFPLWSFEWKCLYHLFCGWFNEHMMLSHERFLVNLYFVSYAALHEAPSKAISSPSSIQMIINHVVITFTWVHLLKQREKEIFLSGGRITYDPFYVLLRTLENNNTPQQKHTNNWKALSVVKSDGICIFCLPSKKQAKEITRHQK